MKNIGRVHSLDLILVIVIISLNQVCSVPVLEEDGTYFNETNNINSTTTSTSILSPGGGGGEIQSSSSEPVESTTTTTTTTVGPDPFPSVLQIEDEEDVMSPILLSSPVPTILLPMDSSEPEPQSSTQGKIELSDKPSNLSAAWVTDQMMELTWREPEALAGEVVSYRIYFADSKLSLLRDETFSAPPTVNVTYALTNLDPFTEYQIRVTALTHGKETEPSELLIATTDVGRPGPPLDLNISCPSDSSLSITWSSPAFFYRSIDIYYIQYRLKLPRGPTPRFKEVVHLEEPPYTPQSYLLQNLTVGAEYEIRLQAGTRSLIEPSKSYRGSASVPRTVLMRERCEQPLETVTTKVDPDDFLPMTLGISVGAFVFVILVLIAVFVWRHYVDGAYYYLDDPSRLSPLVGNALGWEGDSESSSAIPTALFEVHVAALHVDGDIGFSKEYDAIQAASAQEEFTSEHSLHPDNKLKNRYLNIVAYDHSRVRLQPTSGSKRGLHTEYFNGNYIDGFSKPRAYIGTQGPLHSTFETFWRVVWEHEVYVIVMITNLVERGRKKCDMYWPKEGTETYGLVQVRLLKEEVMATYTLRTFGVKHLKGKKKTSTAERIVYHYHYTNWPDHGTPSHPLPVLSFVKKSSMANPPNGGPIIVHCSAGVGRTGTYIALDAMLQQIRVRGDLNIFGFLNHIRAQRNFLVQTEEQYIFIHDALLEAIESGETNVSLTDLSRYTNEHIFGNFTTSDGKIVSPFEHQFSLVTKFIPKDFHLSSATTAYNLPKNRSQDCVCTDAYRVLLTPKPGVEGSDYINASFLPGFERLQEYILTQHPLESTVSAFWQMLTDHNVPLFVVISAVDEKEYHTFWPSLGEDLEVEGFRVKVLQESDRVGYVLRDLSIQSLKDDDELTVKMIQSSHWPHQFTTTYPMNVSSIFEVIQVAEETLQDLIVKSPIVVVDKFGGREGATFCVLSTICRQLESERHLDIYLYAKLYHTQRPGVWKHLEDYQFLYRSMEELTVSCREPSNSAPSPGSAMPFLTPSAEHLHEPLDSEFFNDPSPVPNCKPTAESELNKAIDYVLKHAGLQKNEDNDIPAKGNEEFPISNGRLHVIHENEPEPEPGSVSISITSSPSHVDIIEDDTTEPVIENGNSNSQSRSEEQPNSLSLGHEFDKSSLADLQLCELFDESEKVLIMG